MSIAREWLLALRDELRADPELAAELRSLLAPTPATPANDDSQPVIEFLSVPAFCARMKWSRTHVEGLIRVGLPVLGKGRARRIPVRDAEGWLASADAHATRHAVSDRTRAALQAARRAGA
ncbi:MAG: hypothetical protein HY898_02230 [Deltaproteobacteria bacterium]|nr:hypothetical protein [Deltaproteobacteria bacterium]